MKTSFCPWLGMSIALSAFHAYAATRSVWQSSPNPAPPYTDWATAARVIQDAVDAAQEVGANFPGKSEGCSQTTLFIVNRTHLNHHGLN